MPMRPSPTAPSGVESQAGGRVGRELAGLTNYTYPATDRRSPPYTWQKMLQSNLDIDRREREERERIQSLTNASADPRSSVPSREPVADAVQQRGVPSVVTPKPKTARMSGDSFMESAALFIDYEESAEDASHLTLTGGGTLLSVMSGKQAQKMGAFLIGKAEFRIVLTAYTFDLLMITEALKAAAARDVVVTVICDTNHTLTGTTAAMVSRLASLRDAGVRVELTKGVSGNSGIQHSKTLLCDEHVIIGSCNWTNSSRLNQEMCVLLSLNAEGRASYEERLRYLQRYSELFTVEEEQKGRKSRGARSVPPVEDRYRTARRFSIARARSASRAD